MKFDDDMDKARYAFLSVVVGMCAHDGNDVKHVSYVQEKIDFAFMVRSVNALRGALDGGRLAVFDDIMENR